MMGDHHRLAGKGFRQHVQIGLERVVDRDIEIADAQVVRQLCGILQAVGRRIACWEKDARYVLFA